MKAPAPIADLEFGLTLPVRLVARPFAHRCPSCRRGSARHFFCTVCNVRSVTAGVALLTGVAA